jgi:divalent metal cation (Fe/Co/Zn/Cd) transporter
MFEKKRQNFNDYWKALTIIHLAMALGQVMFLIVVLFLQFNGEPGQQEPEFKSTMFPLALLLSSGGIIIGHFLYIKRVRQILPDMPMKEKLESYRSATIVRLAFVEGGSLFSIFGLLLTGDHMFMGIAILLIAIFIYYRPTKLKLMNELPLSDNDHKKIKDPYIYL